METEVWFFFFLTPHESHWVNVDGVRWEEGKEMGTPRKGREAETVGSLLFVKENVNKKV